MLLARLRHWRNKSPRLRIVMKTADELWMIKPLILLSLLVAVVHPDCDRRSGPAGVTECFLGLPYYSQYQCGTCLTNAYIIQKSGGRHICRDNASYCYYQCMIETYSVAEGPVYEGCSCVEGEPLPQADSILPADCYSPDGTDCSWYSRCLAARYPCSGHQAEYAVSYGAKFCGLHVATAHFSAPAAEWINAVRKCLQVELAPLLRLCRRPPSCQEIRKTAFQSHEPCYFNPYGGFSVCQVPVLDWLRVFWTLKDSFAKTFVESFKTLLTAARSCGSDYQHRLGQLVYVLELRTANVAGHANRVERSVDMVLKRPANDDEDDDDGGGGRETEERMSADELAHAAMMSISKQLDWDATSTVDWYAFALPPPSPLNATASDDDELISVQLFMVDLVDIGLMNDSQAAGRRRLNDTIRQLSDVIGAGLRVDVDATASGRRLGHVTVTSLRLCDSDVAGCGNSSLVAVAAPAPAKTLPVRPAPSRSAAAVTSRADHVTWSRRRTVVVALACLCFMWSICLGGHRLTDSATI